MAYPTLQQSVQIQSMEVPDIQGKLASVGTSLDDVVQGVAQTVDQVEAERLDAEKEGHILDVRNKLMELKTQTLDPKTFDPNTAIQNYQEGARQIIGGTLSRTNPKIRSKVANAAAYYAFNGKNVISNQVSDIEKEQLRMAFGETINKKITDASNAAYSAGTGDSAEDLVSRENAAKLKAQGNQLIKSAVGSGLISGAYGANLDQSFKHQLQEQSYLGGLQEAMKRGEPNEFLTKFEGTEHKELSPDEKQKISLAMHKHIEIYRQQHGITVDKLNGSVDDLALNLQNRSDTVANRQDKAKLLAEAQEWFPNKYDEIKSKLDESEKLGAMVQATKYARRDEALAIASKYAPKEGEQGIAEKTKSYNQVLHVIQQNYKAFVNDPPGYLAAHPAIVAAKKKFAYDHTTDWVETLKSVERQMGANETPLPGAPPIAILPKAIAQSVAQQVYGRDPSQQVKVLNAALAQFDPTAKVSKAGELIPGKHASEILHDLQRNGLPTANTLFFGMTQNVDSRNLIPAASAALVMKPKEAQDVLRLHHVTSQELMDNVADHLEDFMSSMSGYQSPPASEIAQTANYVKNLATVLISQGMDADDAAEAAAKGVINNNFDYSTINGTTFRYPKGMSGMRIKAAAHHLGKEAANAQLSLPPTFLIPLLNQGVTQETAQELYRDEISNYGSYVTTPDNQGVELVDKDGIPVMDAKGVRYIAKFDDLKNSQSALSQVVDSSHYVLKDILRKSAGNIVATAAHLGTVGASALARQFKKEHLDEAVSAVVHHESYDKRKPRDFHGTRIDMGGQE